VPVVVADTGPPRYLILIGEIDLLPRLFDRVIIPEAVHAELRHARAPESVSEWIAHPPPWLNIMPTPPGAALAFPGLDNGEQAALALADSLHADLLLMDDREGVAAALAHGLGTIGTLGARSRCSPGTDRSCPGVGTAESDEFPDRAENAGRVAGAVSAGRRTS
jgi:predicted nucleic acid-binding protein